MPILRRSALAGLAAAVLACAPHAHAGPKIGQPAPDFVGTTFGGRQVSLSALKGDVILLNFWATWCGPCRNELPELEGYFRAASKYGLQILAVATEDSVSEAQLRPLAKQMTIPFMKRMKGPYHDVGALPTSFIIDRKGVLVYAKAGSLDWDALNTLLVPLLNEPIPADPVDAPPAAPTTALTTAPAGPTASAPAGPSQAAPAADKPAKPT